MDSHLSFVYFETDSYIIWVADIVALVYVTGKRSAYISAIEQ